MAKKLGKKENKELVLNPQPRDHKALFLWTSSSWNQEASVTTAAQIKITISASTDMGGPRRNLSLVREGFEPGSFESVFHQMPPEPLSL